MASIVQTSTCLVVLGAALSLSAAGVLPWTAVRTAAQIERIGASNDGGKPDDNRFTPVQLIPHGELDEPMMFAVLSDERVLVIERKGALKVYDPATRATSLVATIPVNTKYYSPAGRVSEAEEGLISLAIDPDFDRNRWVYMKYADPQAAKHVLARWELRDVEIGGARTLTLVESSKKILLENPAQRERCCHTGGGTAWDAQGNLYITVGNNTGGGMTDERPGMQSSDDQATSGNTNDLRGKILRIHPEPDGTYTIPPGNLFPPGTPGTRPEIYTMGHRNPWRVSVDSRTGYIYWGEVGPPDQRASGGSEPWDELNQARGPGFFGFPYFVGENVPIPVRDFVNTRIKPAQDAARPVNESVNNTGLRVLPPAQPAFIAYSYDPSDKYPLVGSGAQSAVGGPVYHRADFKPDATRLFPRYYEGKWLAADFERGWIMSVRMDDDSRYVAMERFLPGYRPIGVIDLKFGPEGDLYVLDYGSTWFAKSPNSSLVRIEYNGGNRAPMARAQASAAGGAPPFQVQLSAADTRDPDGDPLKYQWRVASGGDTPRTFSAPSPRVAFNAPGLYTATLTVTDSHGATSTASLDIVAGNTPPSVSIEAMGVNRTFFEPGQPVAYTVTIADRDDAAADPARAAVSADAVAEDFDLSALIHGQAPVDASTRFAVAKTYLAKTDCLGCHQPDTPSVGPSFQMLASRYRPETATIAALAAKARAGGAGVWGDTAMPAHPTLAPADAMAIVTYMLRAHDASSALPLAGRVTPDAPPGGRGKLVLRAVYADAPVRGLPSRSGEAMTVLRSTVLSPAAADVVSNVSFGTRTSGEGQATRNTAVTALRNGYVGFKRLDLGGVRQLRLSTTTGGGMGAAGGTIEVRLGGPDGTLVGQATVVPAAPRGRGAGAGAAAAAGAAAPARGGVRGDGPATASVQEITAPGPTIDLTPATGMQDVYFVFRNDRASATQPLFAVSAIRVVF
ncbi:MAG: PQQ-dependent sugar dehydrogenase [Acidobacteria bacterium]|nr:PQQ-dependent sugar dehydrogenase [Acidobacteriota bacterium]